MNYVFHIKNEYIYNYYQIGASLQGIANEDLRPTDTYSTTYSIDMAAKGLQLHADLYWRISYNLLTYSALPLVYGYTEMPDNGGKIHNSGVNIRATQKIIDREFKLNGTLALNYNCNKIKENILKSKENEPLSNFRSSLLQAYLSDANSCRGAQDSQALRPFPEPDRI